MFQYAAGKALSKRLNTLHICDISSYQSDNLRNFSLSDFNITSKVSGKNYYSKFKSRKSFTFWKNKILNIPVIHLNDPIWRLRHDFFLINKATVLLTGYWAWSEYFENLKPLIADEFSLKQNLQNELTSWCNNSILNNSVAVHIRRGDYLSTNEVKNFGIIDFEYYYNSIKYLCSRLRNPIFYFFSDDIDWVDKNWLKEMKTLGTCIPVETNRINSPALELKKMSMCENQIIANSSFSWWAAWLNQYPAKIVIQPKRWYNNKEWQKVYEEGSLNTNAGCIKI